MQFLLITSALVIFHCTVSQEISRYQLKPAANQRAYQTAYQPYNYYPQRASNYRYDNSYESRDESQYYPSTYDLVGSQLLMISGGVYKPDYSEDEYSSYSTGYKPYAYDNGYKYYDNSGSRYPRKRYGQQGAVYY
ncbi:hypothetical protein JTE90_025432 [Oedothorax gibbosus]|uniref:Uncharacterized protein n=1 Tax=Oedothorax gibbosus TaxID=931172 RepID=A0AAV6U7S7_9ARAC|nr:hypothetical protein JTE90_025432 [Oedothorax gibbosus]